MKNEMTKEDACFILGIHYKNDYEYEDLKKAYRKKALLYHPDKNVHSDTTEIFQQVKEAYDFLIEEHEFIEIDEDNEQFDKNYNELFSSWKNTVSNYSNILFSFLGPILKSDSFKEIKTNIFYVVLDSITTNCEAKAISILEKLDKKVFIKIYELLTQNKDVLHITDDFLSRLEEHFSKKIQNDECIIVNPFLDDLFENNIYKLVVNDEKYLIPLWHHELVYDNSGSDLYVRCLPILPDNIEIDENNNIHINRSISIDELWTKGFLEITLGKIVITVPKQQFKLADHQVILLANMGISKINTRDIYDISKKGDIYLHVDMFKAE